MEAADRNTRALSRRNEFVPRSSFQDPLRDEAGDESRVWKLFILSSWSLLTPCLRLPIVFSGSGTPALQLAASLIFRRTLPRSEIPALFRFLQEHSWPSFCLQLLLTLPIDFTPNYPKLASIQDTHNLPLLDFFAIQPVDRVRCSDASGYRLIHAPWPLVCSHSERSATKHLQKRHLNLRPRAHFGLSIEQDSDQCRK